MREVFPSASYALKPSRELVAFHEAGHAACAIVLELPMVAAVVLDEMRGCVTFHPTQSVSVECSDANEEAQYSADFSLLAAAVARPNDSTAVLVIDFVTTLMAGKQAELLYAGHPWNGAFWCSDRDMKQANYMLQSSGWPASIGYCQLRARALLSAAWDKVEAIATGLIDVGEVHF